MKTAEEYNESGTTPRGSSLKKGNTVVTKGGPAKASKTYAEIAVIVNSRKIKADVLRTEVAVKDISICAIDLLDYIKRLRKCCYVSQTNVRGNFGSKMTFNFYSDAEGR